MLDQVLKYQAVFFGDMTDLSPTPAVVKQLIDVFEAKNLIPSTYYEIHKITGERRVRVRLSDAIGQWSFLVGSDRVDVHKTPVGPEKEGMGTLEAFCTEAANLLCCFLDAFPRTGNRLALVTEGMCEEMSEVRLAAVCAKLLNMPRFYQANSPFEWDWRLAAHYTTDLVGRQEKLNVIAELRRRAGAIEGVSGAAPFDRIHLKLDVNSLSDNTAYRFDRQTVEPFLEVVHELIQDRTAEILEFIND